MQAACSRKDSSPMGRPSNRMTPCRCPWGVRMGFRWRSRVVFPQPEGPQSTTNSPG